MHGNSQPRIRVTTSDPRLKDKLTVNLQGNTDTVYWYIKFNIPLDEASVNENSMEVTDTDGYIMRTDISYQSNANRIVISPLDSYEEQRFYLLKVSRKVRSEKGQNLKTVISILFKLYRGAISEYKILKKDVPVPPSRSRPPNYDEMQEERKPNDLDSYVANAGRIVQKMEQEPLGVRVWPGFLGVLAALASLVLGNVIAIVVAVVLCVGAIGHIAYSATRRQFRSKTQYNRGVRNFNRMMYMRARQDFEMALQTDPNNTLANYAIGRVKLYEFQEGAGT
jgi:hypothetical protein